MYARFGGMNNTKTWSKSNSLYVGGEANSETQIQVKEVDVLWVSCTQPKH